MKAPQEVLWGTRTPNGGALTTAVLTWRLSGEAVTGERHWMMNGPRRVALTRLYANKVISDCREEEEEEEEEVGTTESVCSALCIYII